MTFKKALLRGLLGFPLGVFLSVTITLIISIIKGTGEYYFVVPELIWIINHEVYAFLLQYILSGILGFAFAAGSAVFEVDHWSISKQTGIHFLISACSMLPIAYICRWMENTIIGIISYVLIFVLIYVAIWFIQYSFWKKKIIEINMKLKVK
jgi:hypothetical protein